MSDDIAGWEIVSEHVNRHGFWEMVIGLFAGLRPPPTITYTVRLKSTGATRTITCFGAGELPERIAKGQFDYKSIIPDDDAERVLAGLPYRRRRRQGRARSHRAGVPASAAEGRYRSQGFVHEPAGLRAARRRPCRPAIIANAVSRSCPRRRRRRSRTCSGSTVAAIGGNGAIASAGKSDAALRTDHVEIFHVTRHGIFAAFSHPGSAPFAPAPVPRWRPSS